jgi:hypothetical protein
MKFVNKYTLLFQLIIANILIKYLSWILLQKWFIPRDIPGVEYDIIDYTRLYLVSLIQQFIGIDLSLIMILSILLLNKLILQKEHILSIKYSIGFILLTLIGSFIFLDFVS